MTALLLDVLAGTAYAVLAYAGAVAGVAWQDRRDRKAGRPPDYGQW